jgi:hypothetical protein
MRLLKLLLFSLFLSFGVCAQFVQEIEGEYFGKSITQADIDHLFAKDPNLYWLNFDYKDTALVLPNFKKLDILAIKSETLRSLTMPDTLFELGLIDFNIPSLTSITEPVTPNLFQITLYASLDSLPTFICSSPELKLVDIQNYKNISWSECVEDRFTNGDFEISSLEIQNEIDGEMLSKMVSQDLTEEILEDDYLMIEEEIKQATQKSLRRIALFRRSLGFVLSGVFFLIWVR